MFNQPELKVVSKSVLTFFIPLSSSGLRLRRCTLTKFTASWDFFFQLAPDKEYLHDKCSLTWSLLFSHSIGSDSVTPWTVACQAPLSIGFSRREYTGVDCHFLLQRIFPIQVSNLHWQVDSLTTEPPGKPNVKLLLFKNCSQKSTQGQLWSYKHLSELGNLLGAQISNQSH